jgi:hypothetical protein
MLEKTTEIYESFLGTHLGECLLTLNYFVHESHILDRCMRISDHYRKRKRGDIINKMCYNYYEIQPLLEERDRFVIEKGDGISCKNGDNYNKHRNKPFIRNNYQYSKANIGSNLIAYQFDARGRSRGRHAGRRFPSKEIEDFVLKSIEGMGFQLIRVGLPLTLEQNSEILSKVELLVCVFSGMDWLATTTRTPIFIVGNDRPREVCISELQGYQKFVYSQSYLDVIENLRRYKEDREFYEKNCEVR